MSGDIFSNIAESLPLTNEDVWDAIRQAGLEQDVKAMPMGLHTAINGAANTLSGGQIQRLLIARAMASKPRIFIFDEATSALDNRTQAMVTESLDRLQATRLVIAHRLSTVKNADRIFVVERGKIVQEGNYEELIAVDGVFADLAKRQMLEEEADTGGN